jgi:hypothetical protein
MEFADGGRPHVSHGKTFHPFTAPPVRLSSHRSQSSNPAPVVFDTCRISIPGGMLRALAMASSRRNGRYGRPTAHSLRAPPHTKARINALA